MVSGRDDRGRLQVDAPHEGDLSRQPGIDQIGRADRAVVTRRVLPIRREPRGRFVLELLDRDHRSSMSNCHVRPGTV